jgi:hypothetical protein
VDLGPGEHRDERCAVFVDEQVAFRARSAAVYRVGTGLLSPLSVQDPRVKRGMRCVLLHQALHRRIAFASERRLQEENWRRRFARYRLQADAQPYLGARSAPLGVCPLTRRLHDDRWGVLPFNTDAAARSFEAARLGEENLPRWQQGDPRSQPLPNNGRSTSSYVLGSAISARTFLEFPNNPFLRMSARLSSSEDITTIGSDWLAHGLLSQLP